jgi:hypothetical protein
VAFCVQNEFIFYLINFGPLFWASETALPAAGEEVVSVWMILIME